MAKKTEFYLKVEVPDNFNYWTEEHKKKQIEHWQEATKLIIKEITLPSEKDVEEMITEHFKFSSAIHPMQYYHFVGAVNAVLTKILNQ